MNKTQRQLASLSMDLKRVALGFYRNSNSMANRFIKEAIKRSEEIDAKTLKPYIRRLLTNLDSKFAQKDKQKIAEDAMMYSILFQNAALKLNL